MKFPNSILLRYNYPQSTEIRSYWIIRCFLQDRISASFASKFLWFQKKTLKSKLLKKPYKFTIEYSKARYIKELTDVQEAFYKKTQAPNSKLKKKLLHSDHIESQIYDYLTYPDLLMNYKKFLRDISRLRKKTFFKSHIENKLIKRFNLVFFKKEKLYTKLKYSRVPQYDAVSGGAAALLSGFLGFLITEKFGLELTDSGDFWFAFMYISFTIFFCHPLLKMIFDGSDDISVFSPSWGLSFFSTVLHCFLNFCQYSWSKIKHLIKTNL